MILNPSNKINVNISQTYILQSYGKFPKSSHCIIRPLTPLLGEVGIRNETSLKYVSK